MLLIETLVPMLEWVTRSKEEMMEMVILPLTIPLELFALLTSKLLLVVVLGCWLNTSL